MGKNQHNNAQLWWNGLIISLLSPPPPNYDHVECVAIEMHVCMLESTQWKSMHHRRELLLVYLEVAPYPSITSSFQCLIKSSHILTSNLSTPLNPKLLNMVFYKPTPSSYPTSKTTLLPQLYLPPPPLLPLHQSTL